jgi:hypothetical protein
LGTRPRKRTHGTGTIIQRTNGKFTAHWSDPETGRRRSLGTFATRPQAETAIAGAMIDGPPPALETTFAEYLTEWTADQALNVKATTSAKYRALTRYVVRDPIVRRKVKELQPADFRQPGLSGNTLTNADYYTITYDPQTGTIQASTSVGSAGCPENRERPRRPNHRGHR